jgi:SET domain
MYNQYLDVRQTNTGNGVFTRITIPAGEPIIEFGGAINAEDKLPNPNDPALLQIGPNAFLGPSGTAGDQIRHSCNPNCKVRVIGNRAILYSLYVISVNNELTFDYSTTSTDTLDKWKLECKCGHNQCRQVISGHQYLDATIKAEYTKKSIFPLYIIHPYMFPKI